MSEASTPDDWPQMIEDCQNRESHLTTSERNFIDALVYWLAEGRDITEPQREKLDGIWERIT